MAELLTDVVPLLKGAAEVFGDVSLEPLGDVGREAGLAGVVGLEGVVTVLG